MDKTIWTIDKLKNWDKNPRAIKKDDFERLKKQIQELGQYKPLLVTPDGTVLGGNMRLKAYQALGITDIWVSIVEPKTEAEMVKYALSDNDRAGYYVEQDLAELIQQYGLEINLDDYKVDIAQALTLTEVLNQFASTDTKQDQVPALDGVPAVTAKGEVIQLGNHRLMCGDATKPEDVSKLLGDAVPDMIFTDPPYGIDYQSRVDEEKRKDWGPMKGDELKGEELQQFLKASLSHFSCPRYICAGWKTIVDFFLALNIPDNLIVWDKMTIGLGAGYRNQYELILFYGSLKHDSETNVWSIKRDPVMEYAHPTQKPIDVIARAINNSSNVNGVILDLFGGSGSTLIACEQLERTCYMMEIDPKYCDVIRKRYENFIPKEVE